MFDSPYFNGAVASQSPLVEAPLDTQFYHTPETQFQPIPRLWMPQRNVFQRLTDHQYYTGSHRERFDEFGNGRGLAGREYIYVNDGMTESPSRCHEVYSSVIKQPRTSVVEPGTLGIQRYGVQSITPKLIWLYRNGDKHHDGTALFIRRHMKTLQHVYQEATKAIRPLGGPARKLYDQQLRPVMNLEEIVDGGKYLCTSGEPPANCDRLGKFLSTWIVHFS